MYFKTVFNHGKTLFRKAPEVADNMFQKARHITTDISRGAGDASRILGQVGNVAQGVLNHKITQEILGLDPRLQRAGSLAQRGINAVNLAGGLTGQFSDFTNERTYKGGHDENIKNAIERAKAIRSEANTVKFI